MLSSAGVTCVAFVSGALAFWAPLYMIKALRVASATVDETKYVILLIVTYRESHKSSPLVYFADFSETTWNFKLT